MLFAMEATLMVAALSGCAHVPGSTAPDQSSANKSAVMTPEQAKEEARSLYEATRDPMPGDWVEYTREWSPCTTSAGDEGASYDLISQLRAQVLPADPRTVAEQTQRVWARFGHPVEVDRDETLTPPRYILSEPAWMAGSGPDGLLLQFTVGDDYADFIGTSRCVAGDSLELSLAE
jgi:uncharacterized protein YceK